MQLLRELLVYFLIAVVGDFFEIVETKEIAAMLAFDAQTMLGLWLPMMEVVAVVAVVAAVVA